MGFCPFRKRHTQGIVDDMTAAYRKRRPSMLIRILLSTLYLLSFSYHAGRLTVNKKAPVPLGTGAVSSAVTQTIIGNLLEVPLQAVVQQVGVFQLGGCDITLPVIARPQVAETGIIGNGFVNLVGQLKVEFLTEIVIEG